MENIQFTQSDLHPILIESIPAHIHTSIKEPNIDNEYYIDEFVFDDDKLLTGAKRKALENRGGSGVLRVLISERSANCRAQYYFGAITFQIIQQQINQQSNQVLKLAKTIRLLRLTTLLVQTKEQELARFASMVGFME